MLKIRQKRQGRWWWLIALGLVVGLVFIIWWLNLPKNSEKSSENTKKPAEAPKVTKIESKIMFAGNSFWGRYTNDAAKKTDKPYEFPFARLHEFERDKYDAWVTGLECPTAKKGVNMTSAQMEATLTFNCDPAYLPEFAKWFTAVSLANNHTDNMGADGFKETQEALDEHKIQYFGHYEPDELDELCDVISLPVRASLSDGSSKKAKLPVAMCGYHGVFKIPSTESVDVIKKYAEIMPVIVMPQSGAEYKPAPDEIKTTLYRAFIDAGADMVIGDHPHWVQTTETYKGKLIVYSMGNFMFDQQFNQEVTRSAAIEVDLMVDGEDLDRWLELGEKCESYQDDCLEQAREQKLTKLAPKYNFGVIATDNKGYQTRPAPELQDGVEQRLRWHETMQALGQ